MSDSNFTASLVRILKNGHSVGLGFLVSSRHILTCAHVVADTLGIDRNTPELPREDIYLDFPLIGKHSPLRAIVTKWYPVKEETEIEDIAVLELASEHGLPKNIHPGVLSDIDSFHGRGVWIFGIPRGKDMGTWVRAELRGPVRTRWIEIGHEPGQSVVAHGFSGSPVWDKKEKAAVGMIVSILRDKAETLTYMIPVSTLIDAWPDLARHSRPLNPYRGLEAFREQDADYFFGREDTVCNIIEKVRENAFIAVIGPSGSGKSSLVYAGLIPALRKEEDWLIADLRPMDIPFINLARVMISLLHEDKQKQVDEFDSFLDKLETGKINIFSVIQPILQAKPGKRLLLIIDQFEELYTMNPDKDLQKRFIDRFLKAVYTQGSIPDFTLLITLRADFMGQAIAYNSFAEILDKFPKKILKSMEEEGLRNAIARPAEMMGVELERGLEERILQDLGKEPGNLPLLEFALKELWKEQNFRQMTHDGYERIGGVKKALANYADKVYESFNTEQEKENLRRIFIQLIRPSEGTEDTRQLATRDQIHERNWDLVRKLADARLIVTGRDEETGIETVELVHDSLIHHWQPLQEWMNKDREFRVWQNRLRYAMQDWVKTGKDEGSLLRSSRLLEAQENLINYKGLLSDNEQVYIKTSINVERKYERYKLIFEIGLIISLIISIVFGAVAGWKWWESNEYAKAVLKEKAQVLKAKAEEEKHRKRAEKTVNELHKAQDYIIKGITYSDNSYYEMALDYFQKALDINRDIKDYKGTVNTLINIGSVYEKTGQYSEALSMNEQALSICRDQFGTLREEGIILSNIGNVYKNIGEYEKSLSYYEQALVSNREFKARREEVRNLNNLGEIFTNLAQYEKALGYYNMALSINRSFRDPSEEGRILSNIGVIFTNKGQYQKALRHCKMALTIHKEIGDRLGEGTDLSKIGVLYRKLCEYRKSLLHHQEALSIKREISDIRGESFNLSSIGSLYGDLGQYQRALSLFEKALSIKKKIGDVRGEGDDLSNIGMLFLNLGEYSKALRYSQNALEIHKQINDRKGQGNDYLNIGLFYFKQSQYKKSLKYLLEALSINREIANIEGEGVVLYHIGNVYINFENYIKAQSFLRKSLSLLKEINALNELWKAQSGLALIEAKLNNFEQSVAQYESAMDTIDKLRIKIGDEENKIFFLRDKVFIYESFITLLQSLHERFPQQNYAQKALEIFERKQARTFLDQMGKSGAKRYSEIPDSIVQEQVDLSKGIYEAQNKLSNERSKSIVDQDLNLIQNIKQHIINLQDEQQALQIKIKEQYPDYHSLQYPHPSTLHELQNEVLKNGDVILIFNVMDKCTVLWIISKDSFGFFKLYISEAELQKEITDFRSIPVRITELINNGKVLNAYHLITNSYDKMPKKGYVLYKILFPEPVQKMLKKARYLYIVPSGPLCGLPFGALVTQKPAKDSPDYLIQDYSISYLSSASLLKILSDIKEKRKKTIRYPLLAFANPKYSERCLKNPCFSVADEIPNTEGEVMSIAELLNVPDKKDSLQLRKNASRSRILLLNDQKRLDDYQYLLFSTHAILPGEIDYINQPALVLSYPETEGYLTMSDILGLQLNADLVVLSAGNTGRGEYIRGEGIMGLTRAFMYAGTQAVSATLWSVDSYASSEINIRMFRYIKSGISIADALRRAKLDLLSEFEDDEDMEHLKHPFFWAPFVIFGDGG
ncbi:MAG: tetratricopeptide repeat protein [Desulfobacterales bacterium]|nr:tetratricopeptide repeat protein [Desulfobacterales bacterium]